MKKLIKYKTFKELKEDKESLKSPLNLQSVNEEYKDFILTLRKSLKPISEANIPSSDKFVSK